jgi:hypothetical protein
MHNTLHAILFSFILNMQKSINYGTLDFLTFSIRLLMLPVVSKHSLQHHILKKIQFFSSSPTFSDFNWIYPANHHFTIAPYSYIITLWGVRQPEPSITLSHLWYLTTDFSCDWALGWMEKEKFKEAICQVHLRSKIFLRLRIIRCALRKRTIKKP